MKFEGSKIPKQFNISRNIDVKKLLPNKNPFIPEKISFDNKRLKKTFGTLFPYDAYINVFIAIINLLSLTKYIIKTFVQQLCML